MEKLGQSFFVERSRRCRRRNARHRGGRAFARRTTGVRFIICGSPDAINATLYDKLSYNFLRDTTPIAAISRGPNVLVVHPSFPARTIP